MQITLQQKGRGLIHSTVLNGTELELGRISQSVSHRTFQLYMRDLQQFAERLNPTPVTTAPVEPYSIDRKPMDAVKTHVCTTPTVLVDTEMPLPSDALTARYSDYVQKSGQLRMLGSGLHGGALVFRYYLKQSDGTLSIHQSKFNSKSDNQVLVRNFISKVVASHNAQDDAELITYLTQYGAWLIDKLSVGEVVDNKVGTTGGVKRKQEQLIQYSDLWHNGETLIKINAPVVTDRHVLCRLRFHRYGITAITSLTKSNDSEIRIDAYIRDLEQRLKLTLTAPQRVEIKTAVVEKVTKWLAGRK